jgi:hypothetical protein
MEDNTCAGFKPETLTTRLVNHIIEGMDPADVHAMREVIARTTSLLATIGIGEETAMTMAGAFRDDLIKACERIRGAND